MPVPISDYDYNIKPALIHSNNRNPSTSKTLPVFRKGENLFTNTGSLWCMDRDNQDDCVPDENYILQPDQKSNLNIDSLVNTSVGSYNPESSLDNNIISRQDNIIQGSISSSNRDKRYRDSVLRANQRCIEARFRPIYLHVPKQFLEICQPQGYESNNPAAKL